MRICVDLDGTICEYKSVTGDYATVRPLPDASRVIKRWRADGHYIILNTARHMKTTNSNVGLTLARQAKTIFKWLDDNEIEYDEIYFGKPHADVYIDDNALTFNGNWATLDESRAWRRSSEESSGRINLLVTMAGGGSRFRNAGFKKTKPLIEAFGEPMYRHAVRSLPLKLAAALIFVILEDEFANELESDIQTQFGTFNVSVVRIPKITGGQAETMLAARPAMRFNLPLLVHNADSAFISESFGNRYKDVDGALLTFKSNEPRWSFARLDDNGRIREVREKRVISDYASTGTYYFRSSIQAFELAEVMVKADSKEGGEYYIAPLYNKMIEAEQILEVIPVEDFICFGTPADLADSERDPRHRASIERLRDIWKH